MLFFCLKAQALQEFKVEKRTSIYDLDDNLLVDLKKGDSVCVCGQASSSFHVGGFLNVCNNDNEIIGKLANGNEALGAWVTPSCSQGYTIQENTTPKKKTEQVVATSSNLDKKSLKKAINIDIVLLEEPIDGKSVSYSASLLDAPNYQSKKIYRVLKSDEIEILGRSLKDSDYLYVKTSNHVGFISSFAIHSETKGASQKERRLNLHIKFDCILWENNKDTKLMKFRNSERICKEINTTEVVKLEPKKTTTSTKKQDATKSTQAKVIQVASSSLDKKSLKEELKYWKELFEDELITQKEYDAKRKALLEGGVTVTQTKKTTKPKNEIVKKAKVDKSYKNKDYLYPKIGKRFNAWRTSKIINRCMSDYKKILESIECTKDNIRATNRYKKGRLYMDLYNLHLNSIEGVETAMLNGQITESQAKNYILQLNSQTISSIELRDAQDDAKRAANKQRGDALMKLGQEMMKPGFDWTTGTSSSTNQNNNNSFQNSNRKPCMYNFATNEYQQCVHLGADQVCYHFTLPCTP